MTWFRVDDNFADHPKVDALLEGKHGADALALWTLAGCWCAKQLTDGVVPSGRVRRFGLRNPDAAAAELVRVGLWLPHPDGYAFHDWSEYQPTRESVLAERAAATERQRKRRESRRDSPPRHAVTSPVVTEPESVSHSPPTRPDPTRPDQHTKSARVRGALVRGYQERYERTFAQPWMSAAKAASDIDVVTRTCEAAGDPEAFVTAVLDGAFADAWMLEKRVPWGPIAKDPAKYAGGGAKAAIESAKTNDAAEAARLTRAIEAARLEGDHARVTELSEALQRAAFAGPRQADPVPGDHRRGDGEDRPRQGSPGGILRAIG